MIRKNHVSLSVAGIIVVFFLLASSCYKDDDNVDPVFEPITFVDPDTNVIARFPGDSITFKIQLTTHGNIANFIGEYHLDVQGENGFDPSSDITKLFAQHFFPTYENIRRVEGLFIVPEDTVPFFNNHLLERNDVIRLKFSMLASEPDSICCPQRPNPFYYRDDRYYEKILKIRIK